MKKKNKIYLPGKAILMAWLIMLWVMRSDALAGEKLFLAGAEGGVGAVDNFYTYAGLVAPLVGDYLGNGFVQRYWADFLGYGYETTQKIDATAVGLEAALGYQISGKRGWAALYGGFRYNNTWLSPEDPFNRNRGEQWWPKGQFEGEINFAERWKLSGIASYIFEARGFWLRTRLLRELNSGRSTGPEIVHMGDPNFKAWQFDWVYTGFKPFAKSILGFKAGIRITESTGVSGLIGIEFSNLF